jgi:hypothetical protein
MDPALLADPRARALLAHLLAYRDAGGGIDLDQARATLDETLATTLDEVLAQTASWLPIDPPALPRTVAAVWQHLRLAQLDREQAQACAALDEARAAGDEETLRALLARLVEINAAVDALKRAGAQRSASVIAALSIALTGVAATATPAR